ncbi:hypothetical protein JAAARDRAFT_42670 [Jaapia argillacea MUCL 33604]|uniref:Uncharacterized protein n=1 Tax=Jaapia argillacea MUCL 33604 TaxID=933084 RepID=A0A067P407_9AGAM|nr:hypothetical protein JAAARDRAFT_42670 [Jaapia argillacea MUCL 33604]
MVKTTPLRFGDECPELPASRPLGFPHIISDQHFDEETDKKNLRAVDAAATLLFRWKREACDAFLNLDRAKFEYSLKREGYFTMIIARNGQQIIMGFIDSDSDWQIQLIYYFSVTGEFLPKFGSSSGMTNTQPNIIEEFGCEFAKDIMYGQAWTPSMAQYSTHNVSWTKLPGEEGYGDQYKPAEDFYGMPKGWRNMTDEQVQAKKKEKADEDEARFLEEMKKWKETEAEGGEEMDDEDDEDVEDEEEEEDDSRNTYDQFVESVREQFEAAGLNMAVFKDQGEDEDDEDDEDYVPPSDEEEDDEEWEDEDDEADDEDNQEKTIHSPIEAPVASSSTAAEGKTVA